MGNAIRSARWLLTVWVSLAALHAGSAGAAPRVVVLGRSLDGRPIRAVEVGDRTGTRVLVVGCVHGNECAGVAIAARLERTSPRGVDLWIVPVLNPDGRAAGTRGNAHGVDLNRNFPWRWRRMGGFYESGPRPLSEPEARIAYRLILRLRPHVSIWFHQHLDLVWASGGDRSIERRFARLSGCRTTRCRRLRAARSPGRTTRCRGRPRSRPSCRPASSAVPRRRAMPARSLPSATASEGRRWLSSAAWTSSRRCRSVATRSSWPGRWRACRACSSSWPPSPR